MTLFLSDSLFSRYWGFWENIFQNAQYLKNGDSDQKVSWITKTRNSISCLFYSWHLFDPIRRFRDIERFLEKTLISKTATRIKKVSWIKKTRNSISRLFYTWHFFNRFAVFEILSVFWKIRSISRKRRLGSKKCHEYKRREIHSASFLYVTLFWSDSPFSRYWAFLGK